MTSTTNERRSVASTFVFRGGLATVAEQPFYSLTAQQQFRPDQSIVQIARNIFREYGLFEMWRGTAATFVGRLTKDGYRLIATTELQLGFDKILPQEWNRKGNGSALGAALTLAASETTFILPSQRLFTGKTLDAKELTYAEFFKKRCASGNLKDLYRGYVPASIYRSASWAAFLVANNDLHKRAMERYQGNVPYPVEVVRLLSVAGISASIASPWEYVMRQMQANKNLKEKGFRQSVKMLHETYGLKGFAAGMPVIAARQFIHALFLGKLITTLVEQGRDAEKTLKATISFFPNTPPVK